MYDVVILKLAGEESSDVIWTAEATPKMKSSRRGTSWQMQAELKWACHFDFASLALND